MIKLGDKKRGRPVKSDSKRRRIDVRLSDKELARVYMLAEELGVSCGETLRIALNEYFERKKS